MIMEAAVTEWRKVDEFPDYDVSDEGTFRVHATLEPLPTRIGSRGYREVRFPLLATRKTHQLVARAFYGPRPPKMVTRHIDGDPSNSHLSNLAYGTNSENMLDRVTHGTDPWAFRTHCANGHEYTPENTYKLPGQIKGGRRACRACRGIASNPTGRARTYGKGTIFQRTNTGLWVGKIEQGKDPVTGKRLQRTFTSMDKDVVLAKMDEALAGAA